MQENASVKSVECQRLIIRSGQKRRELEERGAVSKRIRELKPIVEAIKEKERKEKEEAERKRLEELEEARKKREAELMAMYGEEEEELLEEEEEEEILEEEETLDYDLENLDSNPEETNTSELKSEPAHKVWKHIPGTLTVTQLVEESGAFSGTKISLCGNVCYLETEIDGMIFNLEDEDESVECLSSIRVQISSMKDSFIQEMMLKELFQG